MSGVSGVKIALGFRTENVAEDCREKLCVAHTALNPGSQERGWVRCPRSRGQGKLTPVTEILIGDMHTTQLNYLFSKREVCSYIVYVSKYLQWRHFLRFTSKYLLIHLQVRFGHIFPTTNTNLGALSSPALAMTFVIKAERSWLIQDFIALSLWPLMGNLILLFLL